MKRHASAQWQEISKPAKGPSRPTAVCWPGRSIHSVPGSRTERTNPEELIAAAHAGCFTSGTLRSIGAANLVADQLATTATVTMEKLDAGWTVTGIHLDVKGKVPNADAAAWDKATTAAKTGCPHLPLIEYHHHHGR